MLLIESKGLILDALNFSYYCGPPGAGQLLLPGFPATPGSTTPQLLSGSSIAPTAAAVPQTQLPQQLPYSTAGPTPTPQQKKFRPPLRSSLKSQRYIPKPIPVELGNLKTYSKYMQAVESMPQILF